MRSGIEILSYTHRLLKNQWGLAIGTSVAYGLIAVVLNLVGSSLSGPTIEALIPGLMPDYLDLNLFGVLWTGAFSFGYARFVLKLVRQAEPEFEDLFSGFQHWAKVTWASIVYFVRVLLWLLLLVIPGLIKFVAYSQLWYVLQDEPQRSAREALKRSEELMNGHKWEYVALILWCTMLVLASIFTLFIGLFWFMPWIAAAQAQFYQEVKADWEQRQAPIQE
jgi:uncharacterized membrane protein